MRVAAISRVEDTCRSPPIDGGRKNTQASRETKCSSKVRDAIADILDQLTIADMLAMSDGRKVAHSYEVKGKPDIKGKRRTAVRRRGAPLPSA